MGAERNKKTKLLIVDDSEMNRAILTDMIGNEYEIIEAENGEKAVAMLQKYNVEISLMLLDLVMPVMDGFEVLKIMNRNHWIDDIPVIIISSENATSTIVRAYELGVTDFIARPFDAAIVERRVANTILLYAKQKNLLELIADQVHEKEQRSNLMIDVLSHVMGFKNGEGAQHTLSVRILTENLLAALIKKTDKYKFTMSDITSISLASALHDIGKFGIPDEVLNKPGRLTAEEFEVIKSHSMIGAQILDDMPIYKDEPIVKIGYEICRWHHEKYDGKGYPDGLKGDEIPISAQIVSLADVYDALVSERVYKPPYTHKEAVAMITGGQCGAFNPILLECLKDIEEDIKNGVAAAQINKIEITDILDSVIYSKDLNVSKRTIHLLEQERTKSELLANLTQEIQFEFANDPPVLTFSANSAKKLGLDEIIINPFSDKKFCEVMGSVNLEDLSEKLKNNSQKDAVIKRECMLLSNGEERWFQIAAAALWSADDPPEYNGFIAKAIDIHDSRTKMDNLKHIAACDALTGLYNHAHTKKLVTERLEMRPDSKFALAIIDLDYFKQANDNFGHMFGDKVLIRLSQMLQKSIRASDIAARVGGDEFLIFLEYKTDLEHLINRIFNSLNEDYMGFKMSVSMGVSKKAEGESSYDKMFREADRALYKSKQNGRGQYCFYDNSMNAVLSTITPIESENQDSSL